MTDAEIVKKKSRRKRSSAKDGRDSRKTKFPILARIVLSNGLVVEVPKLPMNTSELTTYDHLRIALEHAALAICCLNRLASRSVPKLMLSSDWDNIRLNLEDSLNHLHFAIRDFPSERGSS